MLIDITRPLIRRAAARLPTGIDRVCLATIEHRRDAARAVVVRGRRSVVLGRADSQAAFEWLLSEPGPRTLPPWRTMAGWLARSRHRADLAGEVLFNAGHRGLEDAQYALGLRQRGVRTVFMVHDLIPITHPEYCRQGEDARHRQRMRHALTLASGLVVNSRETLEKLQAHAGEHAWPMPPTVVAPLASGIVAPRDGDSARPLPAPYFVVLGTIEPRKNHLLLLHLWRDLVAQLGAAAPHLVVIGRRGWECQETLNLLDRCAALRSHVHEPRHCTDAQLADWMAHAQALLFPSFCEGYGMPAIEALACGTPVIASDLPVFRESVGEIPDYVGPMDGGQWRELVLDYAGPASARREAQCRRLRDFRAPGWRAHHDAVDALVARLPASAHVSALPSANASAHVSAQPAARI